MIDAQTAYRAYREKRYFGSLDGLRCLCIVMVLWHHSPLFLPDNGTLPQILLRGFTGVDFFFVLSGYLITTLLLREEEREGRFSIAGFYRRRLLRIVPVYFLLVTLVAGWWILVRGQAEWTAYLPYYFLFLVNFLETDIPLLAPTWSLSVEEQYYLVWPALLLLLPWVRWRIGFLLVMIATAVLVGQGGLPQIEPAPPTELARFVLPMGAYAAILIGSLTALVLHKEAGFVAVWRLLGQRSAPVVLFLVLMALWQGLPGALPGWPNFAMHSVMALILASLVVREDHMLAGVLRWPPFVRIGMISYGIYLWHLIGRHFGVELTAGLGFDPTVTLWVSTALYLLASYLIAEASFRFFESYFLKLKDARKPQVAGQG